MSNNNYIHFGFSSILNFSLAASAAFLGLYQYKKEGTKNLFPLFFTFSICACQGFRDWFFANQSRFEVIPKEKNTEETDFNQKIDEFIQELKKITPSDEKQENSPIVQKIEELQEQFKKIDFVTEEKYLELAHLYQRTVLFNDRLQDRLNQSLERQQICLNEVVKLKNLITEIEKDCNKHKSFYEQNKKMLDIFCEVLDDVIHSVTKENTSQIKALTKKGVNPIWVPMIDKLNKLVLEVNEKINGFVSRNSNAKTPPSTPIKK